MLKKALCSFMTVLMLFQACCVFASAEETVTETGAEPETAEEPAADSASTPQTFTAYGPEVIQAGDRILLGFYNGRPVEWTVLDSTQRNDGEPGLFLFSTYVVQESNVKFSSMSSAWTGSDAQVCCVQFYDEAFTEYEKQLIPSVSVNEEKCSAYGVTWKPTGLTDESVFYISVPELQRYFGTDNGAAGLSAAAPEGRTTIYWLRSAVEGSTDYTGAVYSGNYVNMADFRSYEGGRPATNLNLENLYFLTQAGTTEEGVTIWKAAMQDESADFAVTGMQREGDTLNVSWQTGAFGEGQRLVLLLTQADGEPAGYYIAGTLDAESGSTAVDLSQITMPEGGSMAICAIVSAETSSLTVLSTLKAISCTVSFDAGEGTGTMDSMNAEPGAELQLPACTFTAPAGQVFDHWEYDGGSIPALQSISVDSDLVLTAVYVDQAVAADTPQPVVTATGVISLNFSSLQLNAGYGTLITATVPDEMAGEVLQWSTDQNNVIWLNPQSGNSCKVSSLLPGKTTLSCTTADGTAETALQVTVTGNPLVEFLKSEEGITACAFIVFGFISFIALLKKGKALALLTLVVPVIYVLVAGAIFLGIL